jgi:hypothetical protein
MSEDLIFRHRFGQDLVATISVPDSAPESSDGALAVVAVSWSGSGRLSQRHVAPYRTWVLRSLKIVANKWDSTIMYALQTSRSSTEVWLFAPGAEPELLLDGVPTS